MSESFGSTYAEAYDSLYRSKDYAAECDVLLEAFAGGGAVPQRILDLGCGTGSHALELARRSLDVVGVDRSPTMIEIASTKAAELPSDHRPRFVAADIREIRLDQTFDAVMMMFAVLGYQHTNADVIAALTTARAHLKPGGLFAFDVWYGPAVLRERPSERTQVVENGSGTVIRSASGKLDVNTHLCAVDYRLWRLDEGSLVSQTSERHVMRYFFPLELEMMLELAGFGSPRIGSFPDLTADPDESTWNVLVVARAA